MAITVSDNGGYTVDGPDSIALYRLLTIRRALGLEIKCPGMKVTRFAIGPILKRDYGITARTKVAQYAAVSALIVSLGGPE